MSQILDKISGSAPLELEAVVPDEIDRLLQIRDNEMVEIEGQPEEPITAAEQVEAMSFQDAMKKALAAQPLKTVLVPAASELAR